MILPSHPLRHDVECLQLALREIAELETESSGKRGQQLFIGAQLRLDDGLPQRIPTIFMGFVAEFLDLLGLDQIFEGGSQPLVSKVRYGRPPVGSANRQIPVTYRSWIR